MVYAAADMYTLCRRLNKKDILIKGYIKMEHIITLYVNSLYVNRFLCVCQYGLCAAAEWMDIW